MPKPKIQLICGVNLVCRAIEEGFKLPCTRAILNFWRKNKGFPMPCDRARNGWDWAEVCAWVREYQTKQTPAQIELSELAAEAKSRRQVRDDEREQMEYDKSKGLLIERASAERTTVAVVQKLKTFYKQEVESTLPDSRKSKLTELGVASEIIAQFYLWDCEQSKNLITRIEDKCEQESKT